MVRKMSLPNPNLNLNPNLGGRPGASRPYHQAAAPHPGPLPIGWGEGDLPVAPRRAEFLPLPIRWGEGRDEGPLGGTVEMRPDDRQD